MSKLTISILLMLLLTSCGGNGGGTPAPKIVVTEDTPASNPFIHFLRLTGDGISMVDKINILIRPKSQAFAKPVTISYSTKYLESKGYMSQGSGAIIAPVFGLYQNHLNMVDVSIEFNNSTQSVTTIEIPTTAYVSQDGLNYNPQVIKRFDGTVPLGFSYFYLKTRYGSPVVFDVDGELRWIASGIVNSYSTIFDGNKFWIGAQDSPVLYSQELDGTVTSRGIRSATYANAHHNIDSGKRGFLVEADTGSGSTRNIESTLVEVSKTGEILKEWNFASIIADAMISGGDDPNDFVRQGVDWFHMNAAVYVAADDSIIVSSRENFVVKIDYESGRIKWLFGDPEKYWYTFASLRSKALILSSGGLYPVGQHSVSINPDGDLMLFNNGAASFNQPAGAPRGISRSYSTVSAYRINEDTLQAQETISFENETTILSDICSSAYAATDKSMLVNYSVSDYGYMSGNLTPRLVGVDQHGSVAFDYKFTDANYCGFSWNAALINFEKLSFE